MTLHYLMWIVISLSFVALGALYRGHEDLLQESARVQGEASIIHALSLEQLGDIKI